MTLPPYLTKKLTTALAERKELPMWGKLPEFPLSSYVTKLQSTFNCEDLSIELLQADWKEAPDLLMGFSEDPSALYFCMSPLSPSFALYLSSQDLEKFLIFVTDQDHKRTLSHEAFQKAFTQFIFLKALKDLDELSIYEGLKVKLTETPFSEETSYCVDIMIRVSAQQILARLVFPKSFHQIITSHFSSRPLQLHRLDSTLALPLSLSAGHVSLTMQEIKDLSIGDFVILDHSYYHPRSHQGTCLLVYQNTSLFYVKRKQHEIKILDYAEYDSQINSPDEGFMKGKDEMFSPEDESFEEDLEMESEENSEEGEEMAKSEEASPSQIAESLSSADSVPLQLSVEMAKLLMPLKDILALSAGSVVQIPMNIDQKVSLTLNSQVIAKGELVALGDVVGIKISEIPL